MVLCLTKRKNMSAFMLVKIIPTTVNMNIVIVCFV